MLRDDPVWRAHAVMQIVDMQMVGVRIVDGIN